MMPFFFAFSHLPDRTADVSAGYPCPRLVSFARRRLELPEGAQKVLWRRLVSPECNTALRRIPDALMSASLAKIVQDALGRSTVRASREGAQLAESEELAQ